jgi:diguanylate cyclase (GGDEF)-like protein/PAS domain S-box-containing protein
VERSDCCVVTPSRGTAPGVAGRLLAAAWRDLAEAGGPACVLRERNGVLGLAWVNLALCQMLAMDAGELAGRPLRELAVDARPDRAEAVDARPDRDRTANADADRLGVDPVEQAPLGWATAAHRLARGPGGSAVALLERDDGTALRVRVRVSPVAEPHQGDGPVPLPPDVVPACWLVSLDPLGSEVSDLQGALAVAEHRFAALSRCAPVGIFASDIGLRLGYVNDRFVALTGLESHALLGTGWLDAVHRHDLSAVYAAVQTVLGGTPVELTVRLVRDDERQRWLHLRLAPTTTPSRAAGFIGSAEDVTERRSWEEHLVYQARHDPLTGLLSRCHLVEVLADLLSGRRDGERGFAVLLLDLDGFKQVNDAHGHEAGDRALIEVARRLRRVVRDTDLLARVAGDEFAVLLRQVVSEGDASAAARRHLAVVAEPMRVGLAEITLTAGVSVVMPSPIDTPESLLRAADRVMCEAKAAGHGSYRLSLVAGEAR